MKKILSLLLFILLCTVKIQSQTVYITNTGEKYHVQTCRYLKKSCIAVDLSSAVNDGYTPCSVCKPPATTQSGSSSNSGSKPNSHTENKNSGSSSSKSASSQCTATTKKGTRCSRMTTSTNGKCWQHGGG